MWLLLVSLLSASVCTEAATVISTGGSRLVQAHPSPQAPPLTAEFAADNDDDDDDDRLVVGRLAAAATTNTIHESALEQRWRAPRCRQRATIRSIRAPPPR